MTEPKPYKVPDSSAPIETGKIWRIFSSLLIFVCVFAASYGALGVQNEVSEYSSESIAVRLIARAIHWLMLMVVLSPIWLPLMVPEQRPTLRLSIKCVSVIVLFGYAIFIYDSSVPDFLLSIAFAAIGVFHLTAIFTSDRSRK